MLPLNRSITLTAVTLLLTVSPVAAQEEETPVRWQRRGAATEAPVTVFHSPTGINLPTAETIGKNELLFEISHRFQPISSGSDGFWGLDGPVTYRLGLAWAPADWGLLTIQRSNQQDNLDFNFKGRAWAGGSDRFPFMIGAQVGAAWNGELPEVSPEPNPWQYYAIVMLNQGLGRSVGLGLTPAYLRNPNVFSAEPQNGYALGIQGQWYVAPGWSLLGEYTLTEDWGERVHDILAFGAELETGGHFFKLLFTNGEELNPSQVLAGTTRPIAWDQLRFAFNITRLISFGGSGE
jgi:hypothetical protein